MTNTPNPDTRRSVAALLLLLADREELDYARLTDKTNAFIEAVVELAVKRVRADMRELSRVSACLVTFNRGESNNDRSSEATAQAAEPETAAVDAEPETEHAAPSALTYDEASAGLGHDE